MMLKNLKIPVVTISTVEDKNNKNVTKEGDLTNNTNDDCGREIDNNIDTLYEVNNTTNNGDDVDDNNNDDTRNNNNDSDNINNKIDNNNNNNDNSNNNNNNNKNNNNNNNNGEESHSSLHVRAITRKHSSYRKAVASPHNNLLHPRYAEYSHKKKEVKGTVDWSDTATYGEHIWVDTNVSGESCYAAENDCCRMGARKKCVSCRIVAHSFCISKLDQMSFRCKPTFCEGSHRNYREVTKTHHHWVHRKRQEGRCAKCSKSFQQRFPFQSKEIIAIACTWCKGAYHNKVSCFPMSSLEEECSMGEHHRLLIPPTWIIKLPKKGFFKSSVSRKKKTSVKRRDSSTKNKNTNKNNSKINEYPNHFKCFLLKPLPSPKSTPLLVFVNPKSGGNQGSKLLQKFYWYLNPRQVFDLSVVKPIAALELFQKVCNMKLLVCGGDGTVGWILEALDQLSLTDKLPMGIIPLGTGNDMARTLNWGGGYTDEHVSKVLCNVEEATVVNVDRWSIRTEPLPTSPTKSTKTTSKHSTNATHTSASSEDLNTSGVTSLPVSAMNNYFSIGSDAHVSLEFHESREAKPGKFNSRFRNKMFYAGVGGIDILKRSWKDLTEHISVECDGQNFDSLIRQSKFHCLLFLNIHKYAAGTDPWGSSSSASFQPQRFDDGLLEVVGFTAASLASLQMGAHSGVRVTQCRKVTLKTYKCMPAQVDGEPCRLAPSTIYIEHKNQVKMLQKAKSKTFSSVSDLDAQATQSDVTEVKLVSMFDYENLNHDKDQLNSASVPIASIITNRHFDLSHVRTLITNKLSKTFSNGTTRIPGLKHTWNFLDTLTADHPFRISHSKEHQYYVSDVTSDAITILATCINFRLNKMTPSNAPMVDEMLDLTSCDLLNFDPCDVRDDVRESVKKPPAIGEGARKDKSNEQKEAWKSNNDYGKSVFLLACKSGDLDLIHSLKGVVDFSCTDTITGMSCLHYACIHGHCHVIEALLREVACAVLNVTDNLKGQTALHKAASNTNRRIVVSLVLAGCKTILRDNEGFLASMLALQSNDVELSKFLQKVERLEMRDEGMITYAGGDDDEDSEFDENLI